MIKHTLNYYGAMRLAHDSSSHTRPYGTPKMASRAYRIKAVFKNTFETSPTQAKAFAAFQPCRRRQIQNSFHNFNLLWAHKRSKQGLKKTNPYIPRPVPSAHRLDSKRPKLVLGASSIVGFKKHHFNQIMAQGHMLYPPFNRRKHNHSYAMVVNNHHVKLSKSFHYLSKKKMAFYIGFALKTAQRMVSSDKKTTRKRAMPYLVSVMESDTALLLLRCQDQFFLKKSRQSIIHGEWKPRAQRVFYFGDTIQRMQKCYGSKSRKRHSGWLNFGGILRTL